MPTPFWKELHRPGKAYSLRAAADSKLLLVVHCNLCHHTANYLAADLVRILDPGRDARIPPFECGACGTDDYVSVALRLPAAGDYGSLIVRRPAGIRLVQTWANLKLGDEP